MLQDCLLKKIYNIVFNNKVYFQFSFFSIASIASFLSDIFCFFILTNLGINFISSQCIARLIGGCVSFYINRNFSFRYQTNKLTSQLQRFILLFILSYCLSLLAINYFHKIINIELFYAKIISDFICFLFNFLMMRIYVYPPVQGIFTKLFNLMSRFKD